jgi:hypothetical protein
LCTSKVTFEIKNFPFFFNHLGRYCYQTYVDIDVSSLAKGVYMIKIQTDQGFAVKKLVVQ